MKFFLATILSLILSCKSFSQAYVPTPENIKAREWFSDAKFGLFIHWGPFSIPGDGEWVMNNRNITVKNYTRLMHFFNPIEFNAAAMGKYGKKCRHEIYHTYHKAS